MRATDPGGVCVRPGGGTGECGWAHCGATPYRRSAPRGPGCPPFATAFLKMLVCVLLCSWREVSAPTRSDGRLVSGPINLEVVGESGRAFGGVPTAEEARPATATAQGDLGNPGFLCDPAMPGPEAESRLLASTVPTFRSVYSRRTLSAGPTSGCRTILASPDPRFQSPHEVSACAPLFVAGGFGPH